MYASITQQNVILLIIMKADKQPMRTSNADSRYDVNRTLSSYQPARPVSPMNGITREAVLDAPPSFNGSQTLPDDSRETPSQNVRRRLSWKRALLILFTLLITPMLIIAVWDYRNISPASEKLFGTGNLFSALVPGTVKNIEGRTNILMIGYSADDPGHAGAKLTDSIMIISLDKDKETGFMLSIPRDLYVKIPDYGAAKINEAYQAGEQLNFAEDNYPSGGVGLLEKVIEDSFGIKTHYSVTVNYGAVRSITDALGGITVTIESSDPRGLYDPNFKPVEGGPLKLANGQRHIDGQTALRLTRARGSTAGSYGFPLSDFNRTQNQQKVFAAIKAELTAKDLIDPRINKPIFEAIADNIVTDMGIRQVIPIYRTMQSIPESDMQQINLRDYKDTNYLASYRTSSGQSALIPAAGVNDFSDIQALITDLSK